jgi:monoamine oxidase
MAGHAKAVAVYERPFWREDGLSGHSMSRTGPLSEIHDASPETGSGALFGFFNMPPQLRQELGEEKVMERVVDQLTRFYGPAAEKPLALLYKDWSSDAETAVEDDSKPLTDFPEYGPPPQSTEWGQKILFASTETTANQGGHLEGALQSAERAVEEVLKMVNQPL